MKVVIEISGGVCQVVHLSDEAIEVVLIDWDDEPDFDDETYNALIEECPIQKIV